MAEPTSSHDEHARPEPPTEGEGDAAARPVNPDAEPATQPGEAHDHSGMNMLPPSATGFAHDTRVRIAAESARLQGVAPADPASELLGTASTGVSPAPAEGRPEDLREAATVSGYDAPSTDAGHGQDARATRTPISARLGAVSATPQLVQLNLQADLWDDARCQRIRLEVRPQRKRIADLAASARVSARVIVGVTEPDDAADVEHADESSESAPTPMQTGSGNGDERRLFVRDDRPVFECMRTNHVTTAAGRWQRFLRAIEALLAGRVTTARLESRDEELALTLNRDWGIPHVHVELVLDGAAYVGHAIDVPGHMTCAFRCWASLAGVRRFMLDLLRLMGIVEPTPLPAHRLRTVPLAGAPVPRVSVIPTPVTEAIGAATSAATPDTDAGQAAGDAAEAGTDASAAEVAPVSPAASVQSRTVDGEEVLVGRTYRRTSRDTSRFITIDTAVFPRRLVDAVLAFDESRPVVEEIDDDRHDDSDLDPTQANKRGDDRPVDDEGFLVNEDDDDEADEDELADVEEIEPEAGPRAALDEEMTPEEIDAELGPARPRGDTDGAADEEDSGAEEKTGGAEEDEEEDEEEAEATDDAEIEDEDKGEVEVEVDADLDADDSGGSRIRESAEASVVRDTVESDDGTEPAEIGGVESNIADAAADESDDDESDDDDEPADNVIDAERIELEQEATGGDADAADEDASSDDADDDDPEMYDPDDGADDDAADHDDDSSMLPRTRLSDRATPHADIHLPPHMRHVRRGRRGW